MRFSDMGVLDFAACLMRANKSGKVCFFINGIPMAYFQTEEEADKMASELEKKGLIAKFETKPVGRKLKAIETVR